MMQKIMILTATLFFSFSAGASFGELDIVVRESVEQASQENTLDLNMSTLQYKGSESFTVQGNTAIVTTYVENNTETALYKCITRVELPNMEISSSSCEVAE